MQQAVPPLRFATTHLATGLQVHYAEQGDPRSEPVVFVHGYPDSWYSFSRLLPLLAPAQYHAYAFDQRGFGDSERPESGYTPDDFAADVLAFLDAVSAARATLVGHSMGSFVVRRVAETHPERVTRLVLIGSAFTPINDVMLEVREAVRMLEDSVSPEFAREFQASTIHVPVPEQFFNRIVEESLKLPAQIWKRALDGLLAFDDAADLGQIATPTLILWGEQDALFPRQDQERLAAAIPAARLTVYPETGHCPNWERPEQVVADLDAFTREA